MSGAHVIVDDRAVLEALQQMERAARDPAPALMDIGEMLLNSHRARFDAQVDPDGKPWTPLSDAYRARKRRNADKILILDSYLKDLLRYQLTTNGRALELGTDRIYGATQHFGDEARGIPARPFLGMSAEDWAEALTIFGDHLLPK